MRLPVYASQPQQERNPVNQTKTIMQKNENAQWLNYCILGGVIIPNCCADKWQRSQKPLENSVCKTSWLKSKCCSRLNETELYEWEREEHHWDSGSQFCGDVADRGIWGPPDSPCLMLVICAQFRKLLLWADSSDSMAQCRAAWRKPGASALILSIAS